MIVHSCRACDVLRSHVPSRQGLAICTLLADRPFSFLLLTGWFVRHVRRSLLEIRVQVLLLSVLNLVRHRLNRRFPRRNNLELILKGRNPLTVERQIWLHRSDPIDIKRGDHECVLPLLSLRIFFPFSHLDAILCQGLHVLSWVEVDIGAICVLGRLMPRLHQYSFRKLDVLLFELSIVLVVLQ